MSKLYVTTPIYYVNDLPHIGHIYTTVVTDVVARYHRMRGDDVYFLTGTDEHGQKIQTAAEDNGESPQALADRVVSRYHTLWDELGMSHDDFVRTTEDRHHAGVREMIRRIEANDDFYVDKHEGWYCAACETFYTEKELDEGNTCPVHETPAEWKSEENVFFRLSKYQQPLLDLYAEHPEFVRPETRLNEVRSFVESGLRDLSVSRADLDWGIPFPGHEGQTVYVWLDALTNYVSALGFGQDDDTLYQQYWDASDPDTRQLQILGKDILRFHAVYWPAFLMSAGLPLPDTIWSHGWWLKDDRKVSKSSGNVARPDHLMGRIGADPVRFFLMRDMVFGQDATYSDEAVIERYNSDLANDLGNTVSRVVTLARKAFDGLTPPGDDASDQASPLAEAARSHAADYRRHMDELAFSRALEALYKLLAETSGYLVENEPWKRMKGDGGPEAVAPVLWGCLEAVRVVTVGLLPFMPEVAPRVLAAIGTARPPASLDAMEWGATPHDALLPEPEPIFPRIDLAAWIAEVEADRAASETSSDAPTTDEKDSTVEDTDVKDTAAAEDKEKKSEEKAPAQKAEQNPQVDIDQFFATQLKVGTVKVAERIPKSNKLLRLEVDLGEPELRQLVAGISKVYEPDDLVDTQVIVVANLKPAKLMGVKSQGMVLAASEDGQPVLVRPQRFVPPGTQVR